MATLGQTSSGGPESSTDVTSFNGTSAQAKLGIRPTRKHFFASLDATVAKAVKTDADQVTYTETEEVTLLNGNAHVIPAFNQNFGIHNNDHWTLALSIFYVGYCLLEIPANILQRHIGANRFFFMALTFWGLSSLSFVYAKGYPALLVLRVLLGIGEAGYYAGMIYYLSFWYKRHVIITMRPLRCLETWCHKRQGLLAFGLVRAKTSLLAGWQFLFLVEAIPTIIMALMLLLFLPSFPFTATFLTPREKSIAQARVDRDHRPSSHGGMNGWEGLKAILVDINAWLLMVVYNIGTATSTYFLPTIINGLGFTALNAQGLTVAPYAFGYLFTIAQAIHSDHTRDRGWHIMFSTTVSCIGYIILAICSQSSVGASYFALFFVVGGNFSLFPLVMSWAANTFSPTSKRGVGTAFIVSVSNCVSIAAPQIYFDPNDKFRRAHGLAAGCLFMSFLAAFILRTRLSWLNRRKDDILASMSEKEKEEPQDNFAEVPDSDPRFKYMT
ncbi:major facilitator superfamily domain-containing protein [Hysterangium stoloniferum]|nr:major facilitator superfamily domain-containing protein [Hysterangium stoloniferum]